MAFRRPFANHFFLEHKNSVYLALVILWGIGSLAFLFALVKFAGKHGRIEVVGPSILDYNQDDTLHAKEELKSIVGLWERYDPNESQEKMYFFQFASEKSLKLKRIVEQWSGQKFEHLSLAPEETQALIQTKGINPA